MSDDKHAVGEQNEGERTRMANPYLKKPAVVRKTSSEGSLISGATASSDASPPAQHEETKLETPLVSAPISVEAMPNDDKETLTFGEKEPAVERLPSRNVSFASAEILTVSELRKHASLYLDYSVRITGVVLHRHVTAASDRDGANVCLVLKDPSVQSMGSKLAPCSILKTPAHSSGLKKRRLSGSSSRLLTATTRKRPFSSLKKDPAAPVNPFESIASSLMEQPTVLVYAVSTQMPVNDAATGDLVMIIGEVTSKPVASSLESILEWWKKKATSTSSGSATAQSSFYLHARILRNVNGTDMRLHDEAIRMRRQHLQQLTTPSPTELRTSNQHGDEACMLQPGWGPPPYRTPNGSSIERNV